MEWLSSDNWVWNYTVVYINRDARGWEGGWLITYYFLAGVPIMPFSDMFCCEQLSPNESKQICDLRLYLEVRLYLGDTGLIFTDPVSCMRAFSQGSHQHCIWLWLSLCILTPWGNAWFATGKQQLQHWFTSWLNTKGMFGRGRGLFFPPPGLLHHSVGWEKDEIIRWTWE